MAQVLRMLGDQARVRKWEEKEVTYYMVLKKRFGEITFHNKIPSMQFRLM